MSLVVLKSFYSAEWNHISLVVLKDLNKLQSDYMYYFMSSVHCALSFSFSHYNLLL
jgi:hypothetical protein